MNRVEEMPGVDHAALLKLNVKLWVDMNYPGAFRKVWPEDALGMVYTSEAAALGGHPFFYYVGNSGAGQGLQFLLE